MNVGDRWKFKGDTWIKLSFQDISRKKYRWVIGNMSPLNPLLKENWLNKPETIDHG